MTTRTFVHADVVTVGSLRPRATAFRVVDGRIDWVGDVDELDDAERAAAVDLGGAVVTPGFLDVHTHPLLLATLAGATSVLPPAVSSLDDLVAALGAAAAGGGAGDWVLGFGYDETTWVEPRKPTRHDLDRVSTTRPVLVRRSDGHSAVCNTRALEIAGVTAATPDPRGGRFERDADGTPTGILTEIPAVEHVDSARPPQTADDLARAVADLEVHYLSEGIVAVCDLLSSVVPDPAARLRQACDLGFRLRIDLFPQWREGIAAYPDGIPADLREGQVRLAGLKLFADGTFSDRTAWCKHPYPGCGDAGLSLLSPDDLRRAAAHARAHGLQLAVHAMGDEAVQQVIDVLGDDEPWLHGRPTVRIEHATLVSQAMVDQMEAAAMTFGVVSHTIFAYAEPAAYERALEPGVRAESYPIRRYVDSALPVALSSDSPTTSWSRADHVFTSVMAAVQRRAHTGADLGGAQAITVAEALALYTSRAAQVAGFDDLGRLEPGCEASFVVLDRDPFAIDPATLDEVQVAQTWLRGELVHER